MKTEAHSFNTRRSKGRIATNLAGRVYGKLKVLGRSPENAKNGSSRWTCTCQCGRAVIVRSDNLTSGRVSSCGCSRHGFIIVPAKDQAIPTDIETLCHPGPQTPANQTPASETPICHNDLTFMDERLASLDDPETFMEGKPDNPCSVGPDPDVFCGFTPLEFAAVNEVIKKAIAQIIAEEAKANQPPRKTTSTPSTAKHDPWAAKILSLLEAQKRAEPIRQAEYLRSSRAEWERRKRAEFYERAMDIDTPEGSVLVYEHKR